jgi:starch phosphorylase
MTPKINSKSILTTNKQKEHESIRTGLGADAIAEALIDNLHYLQARPLVLDTATRNDWYMALAYTVRDRMVDRQVRMLEALAVPGPAPALSRDDALTSTKIVAYFSAEFMVGPHLGNALINLGIREAAQEAVSKVGQDLDTLLEQEQEPGLGNGGLGRLAACYMDSLATLNVLAIGYGIRYEFGIFDQEIRDGWQVERADNWLRFGNPWEITRFEIAFDVKFGGRTERYPDEQGRYRVRWVRYIVFIGV